MKCGLQLYKIDTELASTENSETHSWHLSKADVLLADVSENNPYVYYLFGRADESKKQYIILVKDQNEIIRRIFSKVRIVEYSVSGDLGFISNLENAITEILLPLYKNVYDDARFCYMQFKGHFEKDKQREFADNNYDRSRFLFGFLTDLEKCTFQTQDDYAIFLLSKILTEEDKRKVVNLKGDWLKSIEKLISYTKT